MKVVLLGRLSSKVTLENGIRRKFVRGARSEVKSVVLATIVLGSWDSIYRFGTYRRPTKMSKTTAP